MMILSVKSLMEVSTIPYGTYSLPATIIPYNTNVASHYIAGPVKISGLATQNLIDSLRPLLIRMLI